MNFTLWLIVILFILMTTIGGSKGVRSFFSLFFNFIIIIFIVFLMTSPQLNPTYLTFIGCTFISCINLFYINEINSKTKMAFLSTMITIGLLLIFIQYITEKSMVQGFSEEELEELSIFSLYIGIDFVKVGVSVVIMSTIGAITDVAISITSPMREIYSHHPFISRKDLFLSGMGIGKDILGSNSNTLFFAFFGGYLALLIWFKDLNYSLGQVINSKVFTAEMIIIFSAGIGIALVIPIASWLNALYLTKRRENNAQASD